MTKLVSKPKTAIILSLLHTQHNTDLVSLHSRIHNMMRQQHEATKRIKVKVLINLEVKFLIHFHSVKKSLTFHTFNYDLPCHNV